MRFGQKLNVWHDWFAWYPVVLSGDGRVVWLETVSRLVGEWGATHRAKERA